MRKEYDFSKAKRNPYGKELKRQVTMRLDEATIQYFKELAKETGIPFGQGFTYRTHRQAAAGKAAAGAEWHRCHVGTLMFHARVPSN